MMQTDEPVVEIITSVGAKSIVKQKYIDAVSALGIKPETLAFALEVTPESAVRLLSGPSFSEAAHILEPDEYFMRKPLREHQTYVEHGSQAFADKAAKQAAYVVSALGEVLLYGEENGCDARTQDDTYLVGIMRRLVNVNKLSVEKLAEFTGVDVNALYDFAENPSSLSDADKYHLAVVFSKLHTALNYPAPRSVDVGMFAPPSANPKAMTGEEMMYAIREMDKPIQRPDGQ
jgi:hypothetical protein